MESGIISPKLTVNKTDKIFRLAFYGNENGKQKRIQVHGTRPELMKVAPLILGTEGYSSNVIIGNWSKNTVQLDMDKMLIDKVKYLVNRALNWFNLGGAIIFESSRKEYVAKEKGKKGKVTYRYVERNYLVAFNRSVSWTKNIHIINWIALESGSVDLQKWVTMQCIKESSTLRFSPKIDKPSPKIVFRYGSQNRQIKELLETRKIILNILKQQKKESVKESAKELAVVGEVIRKDCFGYMDNFVTGNCSVCSGKIRRECYEKSFADYLPNVKESNSEVT